MKTSIFLIALSMLLWNMATAQAKYEKEYRLREEEAPASARTFVKALGFSGKVRWYREQGLERTSIEAKTKHKSKKYSIEFDESGKLEDIEIEINRSEVPPPVQQGIDQYLDAVYSRYRINKIQLQLTGEEATLIRDLNAEKLSKEATIRYELVVNAKKDREYEAVELLFSDEGNLQSQAIILNRNTDNLEY